MSSEPFLGVEKSITGRRWIGPSAEEDRQAERLMQNLDLPMPLARVLAARGVPPEDVAAYLSPSLRDLLPDPSTLLDMDKAAVRFLKAYQQHERIAIFADYDVDGGASAALLLAWLRAFGQDATLYIPDRIDEGYGPNPTAMAELARVHDLIICVDCGTLSHDAIAAAENADVIVLDHHLSGDTLPPALAVVNPNRQDQPGDLSHLCAAAVVFLMLVEANRRLRDLGQNGPDLLSMLDLVALATVSDVAPLVGVNRAFVRQGLTVMARRDRPGLAALADVAKLEIAPTAYHLGYLIGPRVNAGGRIGSPDLGARCLAETSSRTAQALAEDLDRLNAERRTIESAVLEEAMAQAEARGLDAPLIWAAGDGWHPGVVGIVAARLKEATGRPAVVIGMSGSEGKGSGRSVPGLDLGASVQRIASEGLLVKGGGHRMAAGLTVDRDNLDAAMARLAELLDRQDHGRQGVMDMRIEGLMMPSAARPETLEQIEKAGPFGQAAPAPRFAFPGLSVRHARRVGEAHLKLRIGDPSGGTLDAIAFGAYKGPLGPTLEQHGGASFHFAGYLELNHWQGKTRAQLRLSDVALSGL